MDNNLRDALQDYILNHGRPALLRLLREEVFPNAHVWDDEGNPYQDSDELLEEHGHKSNVVQGWYATGLDTFFIAERLSADEEERERREFADEAEAIAWAEANRKEATA